MDLAGFVERSKQLRARLKAQAEEIISPRSSSMSRSSRKIPDGRKYRLDLRTIREKQGIQRAKFDPLPLTLQNPLSRRSVSSEQSSTKAISHSPKPLSRPKPRKLSPSPRAAVALLVPVLTARRRAQATPKRYLFSKIGSLCN